LENLKIQNSQQKNRIIYSSFLLIILFWLFDFLTTVIGLSLGATETNQIVKEFLDMSFPISYIFIIVFTLSIIVITFGFLECVFLVSERYYKVEIPIYIQSLCYSFLTVYMILNSFLAVINNISVILSLI
jgi:hypothetical protein